MFTYEFTSISRKQLKKLPKDVQIRIIKKLDFFCIQSNPLRFADTLTDISIGHFRFRIGDYRVVFDVEEDVIVIHMIGNRREIYK